MKILGTFQATIKKKTEEKSTKLTGMILHDIEIYRQVGKVKLYFRPSTSRDSEYPASADNCSLKVNTPVTWQGS